MSNHNEAELAVQQLNRSKKNGKIVNCCRATTKTEREAKSNSPFYFGKPFADRFLFISSIYIDDVL